MGPRRSAGTTTDGETPLEAVLHYRFQNPSLLRWALTHRSLAYELGDGTPTTDPRADNEQLEFLGDAVLGLMTADLLLERFGDSREGELTRLRASLVSRRHLAQVAARLDLGAHLRLGRGEERTGGRHKPALLANALEAILGAVFLDAGKADGLTAIHAIIAREIVDPAMPELRAALAAGGTFSGAIGDHKSALQEHLQAIGAGQPRYVLAAESGPDHRRLFRIEVHADAAPGAAPDGAPDRVLATAEASSKKEAQQEAARLALAELARPAPATGTGRAKEDQPA